MPYANRSWTDGDFKTAKPAEPPVYQSPIASDNTSYVFTQKWMQEIDSFSPLALNTSHPVESTFFLVEEGPREIFHADVVQWVRTYAKKPATYDDWEMFAFNIIGYYGAWGPNQVIPTGRARQTFPVVSRVEHIFYLVGASGAGKATPDYDDPGDIPVLAAQRYRLTPAGTTWWMDVDFLGDNPPFNIATTPNRTTYEGWCQNAASQKWSAGTISYAWTVSGGSPAVSTTLGSNPGQIVAEDSRLDRWHGNIWLRRTRYVLAQ